MEKEIKDEDAGQTAVPSEDIQAPAQSVDFQSLDLDQDVLAEKSSVTCNIAAL